MTSLCTTLRSAQHSEQLENRLRLQFIPILRNLCPTIDDLCGAQGDFTEISGLRADYHAIYSQLKERNNEIVDIQDKLNSLTVKLAERSSHCNQECPHTYSRLRTDLGRFHEFLLSHAKQYIDITTNNPDLPNVVKDLAYDFILPTISMFEHAAEHGVLLSSIETVAKFENFAKLIISSPLINKMIAKRLSQIQKLFDELFPKSEASDINNSEAYANV